MGNYSVNRKDGYYFVEHEGGATLGMSKLNLKEADGLIAYFGVEDQVLLDILAGKSAPGGRLPLKMPASMETVERHREDVFEDIECHVDECGNAYDFGFGLDY